MIPSDVRDRDRLRRSLLRALALTEHRLSLTRWLTTREELEWRANQLRKALYELDTAEESKDDWKRSRV
jgi:hypothetical protein